MDSLLTVSVETAGFIEKLSLTDRKNLGQYMTPQFLGTRMAQKLSPPEPGYKILDPAVGTAELLVAYKTVYPDAPVEYFGFDVDRGMLETASKNLPEGVFLKQSIFDPFPDGQEGFYDQIIGNPPYFELKKNDPCLEGTWLTTVQEKGRLNIYALFFEYALRLLKTGGEMVFLIPPSMNNGAYFSYTRENILQHAVINSIEVVRENTHFSDALTSVQIIHLTKTGNGYAKNLENSAPWVVDFNLVAGTPEQTPRLPIIFTEQKENILKRWVGAKNLHQLGFKVSTGKTPWNQVNHLFVPENVEGETVPLLYSKDITPNNTLGLKPELNHKRFIPLSYPHVQQGKKIIVNRIVGSLNNPKLRYCVVDIPQYVTENHVNVVEPLTGQGDLQQVVEGFEQASEWVGEYLQALTGNTQISATELQYLIPFKGEN